MIVAEKDCWLANFDLSQAESWIVAFCAREDNMKKALMFGDIHRQTAQEALFKYTNEAWEALDKAAAKSARYIGKRFNHATSYRMGPFRATEVINKDSDKPPYVTITLAEAKKFYSAWHEYYNIQNWWREIEYQLNQNRTIRNPYGAIRYFFDFWGEDLFKKATAHIPQSTVAMHMNGAIQDEVGVAGGVIEVDKNFVLPGHIKIINQSHDSILCNIPKRVASDILPQIQKFLLRPIEINGEQFTIPVDCEVGERWGELKECRRGVGSLDIDFSIAA